MQRNGRWLFTILLAAMVSLGTMSPAAQTQTQAATQFELLGLAVHRETGRDIYMAALSAEGSLGSASDLLEARQSRAMEFKVLARRTSIRSLLGGILLQAELASGEGPSSPVVDFANTLMENTRGSLYEGDTLRITYSEDGTVQASLNEHELASSPDARVFNYLLSGWIAEGGPATAFRNSLLASDLDMGLLADYQAIVPREGRAELIASWSEEAPEPSTASAASATAKAKTTKTTTTKTTAEPIATRQAAVASAPVDKAPPKPATRKVSRPQPKAPELGPRPRAHQQVALLSLPEPPASAAIDPILYAQRLAEFNNRIFRQVNSKIQYPRAAVRRNLQGSLELDLTLSARGELLAVEVGRSSGHSLLDRSAVRAAERAFDTATTPGPDEVVQAEYGDGRGTLVVPVPVNFVLRE